MPRVSRDWIAFLGLAQTARRAENSAGDSTEARADEEPKPMSSAAGSAEGDMASEQPRLSSSSS